MSSDRFGLTSRIEALRKTAEAALRLLRKTAETALHQGDIRPDMVKTVEALTVLRVQFIDVVGETPQFTPYFELLDTVKRAVEVEDWESGKIQLQALVMNLRLVEDSFSEKVAGTRKSKNNSGCYLLSIAMILGMTVLACGGLMYFRSLSNTARTNNSAPIRFESPQQAVIQFANGEKYLGTLNSLNSKEIMFQVAGQPQMARLPANTVKYVQTNQVVYIYNPQASGFETAQPQQANLSMMNGQQFTGTLFSLTSNEVIFQVAGQQEIAVVPGNTVREVQTTASRHIYNVNKGAFEKQ